MNTEPQRGPRAGQAAGCGGIQARALLPSGPLVRTNCDLPAARVPPHSFSCDPVPLPTLASTGHPAPTACRRVSEAPPWLYLVGPASLSFTSWACVGRSLRETEGTQPRALCPPEAVHTTCLGPWHTCAPVQVTQPCTSTSSRVPVSHIIRNEPLWVQWLRLPLPMQGWQVQSLVGDRRSHMPRSQIKKREREQVGGREAQWGGDMSIGAADSHLSTETNATS